MTEDYESYSSGISKMNKPKCQKLTAVDVLGPMAVAVAVAVRLVEVL